MKSILIKRLRKENLELKQLKLSVDVLDRKKEYLDRKEKDINAISDAAYKKERMVFGYEHNIMNTLHALIDGMSGSFILFRKHIPTDGISELIKLMSNPIIDILNENEHNKSIISELESNLFKLEFENKKLLDDKAKYYETLSKLGFKVNNIGEINT